MINPKIHVKFPASKAEILKKLGNIPVSYLWENDKLILLKDLLHFVEEENFESELELKIALQRAYRQIME